MIPVGLKKALALLGAFAAVVIVFLAVARPWYLRWGATDAEISRSLPGDEAVVAPQDQTTRAITIEAPPEAVWPWLAQLGQDRGGFYSYEILEDLAGCEMENTDRILPQHQEWKEGDSLWMYPPDKLGGVGGAPLVRHDPGRALVFATHQIGTPMEKPADGAWQFALEPIGERQTRFLVRGRGAGGQMLFGRVFTRSVFEPAHYVMERRMMENIKTLAEGGRVSEARDTAAVALWTATFLLFITSAVAVFRRTEWLRALLGFIAAAAVFQILTLGQPPLLIGMLLVVAIAPSLGGRHRGRVSRAGAGNPLKRIQPSYDNQGERP